MPKEHDHHPVVFARDVFGLTDTEKRQYSVSDARFRTFLMDDKTRVHRLSQDVNSFGEYLFVTLSQEIAGKNYGMTFYGLGYHEYHERWITDVWYWYEPHAIDGIYREMIPKAQALAQLAERRELIEAEKTDFQPSERAILFGILADLTDEDGALTELEDMPPFEE